MARQVFDIFLSSTSKDLVAHRAKVAEMVDRLRQTSIRMETFGAKPSRPLKVCRDEVQKCDALIAIVGHRYGWVPSEEEGGDGATSITWWEVRWALEAKKPVYAFLVAPDALWTGEREQDRLISAATDAEVIEIGRYVRQLHEFRTYLGKQTTHEQFSSAEDLGGKVATSLHEWLFNQATAAAREKIPEEKGEPRSGGSATPVSRSKKSGATSTILEQIYWQEQIHLLSAHRACDRGAEVRIALIAGRANTDHPALSRSEIRQFDVRHDGRADNPDDFTTAIAAMLVGNDAENAYLGVAPASHLTVLQVLDKHYTVTNTDIAVAVDAAIREGAHVICLPLGGANPTDADAATYRQATELGILVACPAGNEATDEKTYPGAYPACLCAAAIDDRNQLAYFSSFGDWVTTTAPGVDLPVAAGAEGYQRMSGTSFSCAILAGVAALVRSVNPGLSLPRTLEIFQSVGTPVLPGKEDMPVGTLRVLDAAHAVALAREAILKKGRKANSKKSESGSRAGRSPASGSERLGKRSRKSE
jgi:hypothetical protein